jgi:hypothetical protein
MLLRNNEACPDAITEALNDQWEIFDITAAHTFISYTLYKRKFKMIQEEGPEASDRDDLGGILN